MTATARDRNQGTKIITENLQKTIDELHVHAAHEPHELIVLFAVRLAVVAVVAVIARGV